MGFDDDDDGKPIANTPSERGGMTTTLGTFATIIAIVTGANTLVVSCSNDRVTKSNLAQQKLELAQQKLAQEEAYWKEAFRELDYIQSAEFLQIQQKEVRIKNLILRTQNHAAGMPTKEENPSYAVYIESSKTFLEYAGNPSDELKPAAAEAIFDIAENTKQKNVVIQNIDIAKTETASEVDTEPKNLVILGYGDTKGYDYDIFWCDTLSSASENRKTAASRNYRAALNIGQYINDSADGKFVGQKVGRVRIRVLPTSLQGKDYPVSGDGYQIRYNLEPGNGAKTEMSIAQSIVSDYRLKDGIFMLQPQQNSNDNGFETIKLFKARTNTVYYISMFACPYKG